MNNQDDLVIKSILDECNNVFKDKNGFISVQFHKVNYEWNDNIVDRIRKMGIYDVHDVGYGFISLTQKEYVKNNTIMKGS
jgi:hypothetical protein